MAFIESQQNPGIVLEVDPTFSAGRVSLKPLEYQLRVGGSIQRVLGHYKVHVATNALAFSANAIIAAMRFTDNNSLAVLLRIYAEIIVATAVTAQRNDPLAAFIARAYTAADGTNATAVVLSGNNGKVRASMASANAVLSFASVVGGMTGGTKTVDANPFGVAMPQAPLAALGTGMVVTDLYKHDKNTEHPEILSQNEGVLVQWGTTTLATGTVVVGVGFEWAEVAAY